MKKPQDKNIYIAFTGGTIGMMPSEHGFIPKANFMPQFIKQLPELQRSEMPNFELHEYPQLIDSANITPCDWLAIAKDIEANYDKYDAFIVLHGTDTMAYTASALSFILDHLKKPVIITGSQIPISALRSDGLQNLVNSLYLSAYYPINEVTLFFNNRLYRGNRATKSNADGFNAFSSPNYSHLAETGIEVEINHNLLLKDSSKKFKIHNISNQPIGLVYLYPGITADVIANVIKQPVNALIILSFGIGNAPSSPEILNCLKEAIDNGVIVINLTQCYAGSVNMQGYLTGNHLKQIGVISGHDMTIEATLTKLHYLLSQDYTKQQVKELLEIDLKGEMTIIENH